MKIEYGFIAAMIFMVQSATAATVTLTCLKSLEIASQVKSLPANWIILTDPGLLNPNNNFQAISFFSGHPKDGASLKYDKTLKTNQGFKAIWNFSNQAEIWFSCSYTNTNLIIAKKLAPEIKHCEAIYRDNDNKPLMVNCLY